MAAGGTPGKVLLGPGRIYIAAVSATDPANASAVLPSASWTPLGYTEDGSEFTFEVSTEDVEVAEEIEAIKVVATGSSTSVTFEFAERTITNVAMALGLGATTTSGPLEPSTTQTPIKIVWDSDEAPSAANRRWLFRSCVPSGSVSFSQRKSPQKRSVPVTFRCSKASNGDASFKVFPSSDGTV